MNAAVPSPQASTAFLVPSPSFFVHQRAASCLSAVGFSRCRSHMGDDVRVGSLQLALVPSPSAGLDLIESPMWVDVGSPSRIAGLVVTIVSGLGTVSIINDFWSLTAPGPGIRASWQHSHSTATAKGSGCTRVGVRTFERWTKRRPSAALCQLPHSLRGWSSIRNRELDWQCMPTYRAPLSGNGHWQGLKSFFFSLVFLTLYVIDNSWRIDCNLNETSPASWPWWHLFSNLLPISCFAGMNGQDTYSLYTQARNNAGISPYQERTTVEQQV